MLSLILETSPIESIKTNKRQKVKHYLRPEKGKQK